MRNYVDSKTYETNAKYNKLTRDLNETVSEIATVDGRVSTLTQRVDEIAQRIVRTVMSYYQAEEPTDKVNGDLWYYTGATTSERNNGKWYRWNGTTWVEITDSEVDTNAQAISEINQTVDGITTRVQSAEGNITTLQQTATGLTSRIQTAEGDINSIEQTMEGVAFKSSLAAGTTTINGGCITTGTIDADLIGAGTIHALVGGQAVNLKGMFDIYSDQNVKTGRIGGYQISGGLPYTQIESATGAVKVYMAELNGNGQLFVTFDNNIILQLAEESSGNYTIRINRPTVLNNYSYGSTLPATGTTGQLFFKI